jgi:hypothetical protein
MGKAKPAKHTSAEIKAKVHAATTNMGGGKAGLVDRLGGKVGHAKFQCPICMSTCPDLKSMQVSGWRQQLSVSSQQQTWALPGLSQTACRIYARCQCWHACGFTCDCVLLQIHHENKHPKLPWDADKCQDLHAQAGGVTTQGVGVRGSTKKK